MRGRTFKRSIIIADEMQNATASQMKMLLTRIGEKSQIWSEILGQILRVRAGFFFQLDEIPQLRILLHILRIFLIR